MVIIMKTIKRISLIISIVFTLIIISTLIVNIVIYNNYKTYKTCRTIDFFNINNYNNISYTLNIKLVDNCDKLTLYIELDEKINADNINGVILQFVEQKKKYNDDNILELILINNHLNYIVIIDKNEIIDIDGSVK